MLKEVSFKGYAVRFFVTFFGLIFAGYGVGLTVVAGLGVSPWDVFGQGVSLKLTEILGFEVMMGTITMLSAAAVIIIDVMLKEKIGFATIIDTLVFGPALNFFLKHNMLPAPQGFGAKLFCTVLGFLIWSLGIAIYMKAHLGAGPKDGLFVAFAKRKIPVALAKNSIEAVVCLIGWLLGGTVGIGTLICVFTMGSMIDFFFKLLKFDVNTAQNESIIDTVRNIKMLCTKK